MRLRNVKGSRETIAANEWVVKDLPAFKGHWAERIFNNTNPIHIEIGMGKGQFIMELARLNPDINYIGIEKYSSAWKQKTFRKYSPLAKSIRFI